MVGPAGDMYVYASTLRNTAAGGGRRDLRQRGGTLVLSGTTVRNNAATGGSGGGIYTTATATVTSGSTVSGNTAGSTGGGLWCNRGDDDHRRHLLGEYGRWWRRRHLPQRFDVTDRQQRDGNSVSGGDVYGGGIYGSMSNGVFTLTRSQVANNRLTGTSSDLPVAACTRETTTLARSRSSTRQSRATRPRGLAAGTEAVCAGVSIHLEYDNHVYAKHGSGNTVYGGSTSEGGGIYARTVPLRRVEQRSGLCD